MRSIDLWILRWSSQALAREAYIVPRAEVSILGVDIDAISADTLGVAAVLLLVFLGLWNQVLRFIVRIPADPVQEGKAITHRDTDFGPKLHGRPCFAANNGTNMALNQVDDAIRDASRLGVQKDRLLPVQLADLEKLPPPVHLKGRKACARSDQNIDGIKISLQVVELAAYGGIYFPSAWPFLFGDIEESGTRPTAIISRLVLAEI